MDDRNADHMGIMASQDGTPRPRRVPVGLLEQLAAAGVPALRVEQIERGRRHAADRAYDDGAVVAEIASRLLTLSVTSAR